MKSRKIEITGLRKRWLINSLSPIFAVAVLLAGVFCAGIANYFDVPVKLVRILVVLSIFFGLALFTLVAYIILSFALDPMPDNMAFGEQLPSSSELLDEVDRELAASETRLREMERYVTSDTFTLRSRFRQL